MLKSLLLVALFFFCLGPRANHLMVGPAPEAAEFRLDKEGSSDVG